MLLATNQKPATNNLFLDKTLIKLTLILEPKACQLLFGICKDGEKKYLGYGINVYIKQFNDSSILANFTLAANPLKMVKESLITANRYARFKEGISLYCGNCRIVYGDNCNDCPIKAKREKADNFLDPASMKKNDIKHHWVQQVNLLHNKIKLLEGYVIDLIGLYRFNKTCTKLNVEINTNILVDIDKVIPMAMENRRAAFFYIFTEKKQAANENNPSLILVGFDKTDKKHKAKYYVKTKGRKPNTQAIVRQEMMLKSIKIARDCAGVLNDTLFALYEKYSPKYQWIEAVVAHGVNNEDNVKVAIHKKLTDSNRFNLEALSLAMKLLIEPIQIPKNNKHAQLLIELGIAVQVMRGYLVIAPEYFYGD